MKDRLIYPLLLVPCLASNLYATEIKQKEIDAFIKNKYGLESLLEKLPIDSEASVIFKDNDKDNKICVSIKNKDIQMICLEKPDFLVTLKKEYIERFKNEDLCSVLKEIKKNNDYNYKRNIPIIAGFLKYFNVMISKEARYYRSCI